MHSFFTHFQSTVVHEKTISPQETPVAHWSLLLSQRQEFLNSDIPRVTVAPNQHGTHEMRDEVLSSVSAQNLDTTGHQLSDMDEVTGKMINWM